MARAVRNPAVPGAGFPIERTDKAPGDVVLTTHRVVAGPVEPTPAAARTERFVRLLTAFLLASFVVGILYAMEKFS